MIQLGFQSSPRSCFSEDTRFRCNRCGHDLLDLEEEPGGFSFSFVARLAVLFVASELRSFGLRFEWYDRSLCLTDLDSRVGWTTVDESRLRENLEKYSIKILRVMGLSIPCHLWADHADCLVAEVRAIARGGGEARLLDRVPWSWELLEVTGELALDFAAFQERHSGRGEEVPE